MADEPEDESELHLNGLDTLSERLVEIEQPDIENADVTAPRIHKTLSIRGAGDVHAFPKEIIELRVVPMSVSSLF